MEKKFNKVAHGFFYEAHCENGEPSSKRLWGGVGFATVQVCLFAATVLSLVKTGELSTPLENLLDFDLVTSASLIGLNTITRMFGNNKTSISNTPNEDGGRRRKKDKQDVENTAVTEEEIDEIMEDKNKEEE